MLLAFMAGVKATHTLTHHRWMQVLRTSINTKGKCSSNMLIMGSMQCRGCSSYSSRHILTLRCKSQQRQC